MSDLLIQLPENIQKHIKEITKSSGLPNTDDTYGRLAECWLEKKDTFENNISEMDMEEVEIFDKDEEKGAIVLTYSGSLINIGPMEDGVRKVDYFSIGLRHDVPDNIINEECKLADDIILNEAVSFEVGPVKKTSPVHKIAVCKDDLSKEEQEEILDNASTMIVDDFIEVNKTVMLNNNE